MVARWENLFQQLPVALGCAREYAPWFAMKGHSRISALPPLIMRAPRRGANFHVRIVRGPAALE
jgi:hypothetical protein